MLRDVAGDDARVRVAPLPAATTLGGALQAALVAARAPYVCVLDAGDELAPDAIARHLASIEAYPPPAATLARAMLDGGAETGGATPTEPEAPTRGRLLHAVLRGAPPPLGACLVRRDHALAAGGFDPTFTACAADDFWLRFASRFAVRGVDAVLLRRAAPGGPAATNDTAPTETTRDGTAGDDAPTDDVVAAELGRALVRAFATVSVDELSAAIADGAWVDPAQARLEIARSLLESGVAEAAPLAQELVQDALRRGGALPDDPAFAALREILPEATRLAPVLVASAAGREPALASRNLPAMRSPAMPPRLTLAVRAAERTRPEVAALLERAAALREHGVDVVLLGERTDRAQELERHGVRVEMLQAELVADELAALLARRPLDALLTAPDATLADAPRRCGVVLLDPELEIDDGARADAAALARLLRARVRTAAREGATTATIQADAAARELLSARARREALAVAARGMTQPGSVTGRLAARAASGDAQREELATVARDAEALAALAPLLHVHAQRILDKLRLTHRVTSGVRALRARLRGDDQRVKTLDTQVLDAFLASAEASARGGSGWLWAIYATDPYSETRGQRSTWIARELARRGHHVVYFYWRWRLADDVLASGDPRVLSVPIDQIPAIQRKLLRTATPGLRKVFLAEFPDVALYERFGLFAAHGFVTIYDCIDDWAEFARVGQAYWYDEAVERYLARNADVVVATHPRLAADLERVAARDVPLVPNGVDLDSLRVVEPARRDGEVVIGYFGHLTPSWFDWELIREAAERRPQWRFEIIGYGQDEGLVVPPNVVLPGMVAHDQLAARAAHWTVAIIPFREGRLTQAVDPVKLYEYLALGLRVVAVGMPHLRDVPGVVVCERDGFEAALETAIATPLDRERVAAFVAESRWSRRVDALLDLVERADASRDVLKALAG